MCWNQWSVFDKRSGKRKIWQNALHFCKRSRDVASRKRETTLLQSSFSADINLMTIKYLKMKNIVSILYILYISSDEQYYVSQLWIKVLFRM